MGSIRRNMLRWRRKRQKSCFKTIKTVEEFGTYLESPEGKAFLKYHDPAGNETTSEFTSAIVKEGENTHIILYDKQFLEKMKDGRVGQADGTFNARPKLRKVRQLLTVMVRKYNRVSANFF